MRDRSYLKHYVMLFVSVVLALACLLEFRVIERVSYAIERGRIRALREAAPDSSQLANLAQASRSVVGMVSPAVVALETEYSFPVSDESDAAAPESFQDWLSHLEQWLRETDPDEDSEDEAEDTRVIPFVRQGLGSGFIIDGPSGHILTNAHVVDGADRIVVFLPDGRRTEAEVLGSDSDSDLAVLQISLSSLHDVPFGDSDAVGVGDDVFAFGNPFGLDGTVSRGIVSAINRRNVDLSRGRQLSLLQTDAAISPGNSGGPLVNLSGEVIGINTAIATTTGVYDGVGFAIPAKKAEALVDDLIDGGPGMLGVWVGSVGFQEWRPIAEASGWKDARGAYVTEVMPGLGAERAGLLEGDIILAIDSQPIDIMDDVVSAVSAAKPGTHVNIRLWRKGQTLTLPVEIGRRYAPKRGSAKRR